MCPLEDNINYWSEIGLGVRSNRASAQSAHNIVCLACSFGLNRRLLGNCLDCGMRWRFDGEKIEVIYGD